MERRNDLWRTYRVHDVHTYVGRSYRGLDDALQESPEDHRLGERIFEILDEVPKITEADDASLVVSKGEIRLIGVSFDYEAEGGSGTF